MIFIQQNVVHNKTKLQKAQIFRLEKDKQLEKSSQIRFYCTLILNFISEFEVLESFIVYKRPLSQKYLNPTKCDYS